MAAKVQKNINFCSNNSFYSTKKTIFAPKDIILTISSYEKNCIIHFRLRGCTYSNGTTRCKGV